MPKVTFEFSLPEDQEEFNIASKYSDYYCALWDIANELFRPARKHGYTGHRSDLLNSDESSKVIKELENRFYQILDSKGIDL